MRVRLSSQIPLPEARVRPSGLNATARPSAAGTAATSSPDVRSHNLAMPSRGQTVANSKPVSARALVWILAGHCQHHLGILHERYGIPR